MKRLLIVTALATIAIFNSVFAQDFNLKLTQDSHFLPDTSSKKAYASRVILPFLESGSKGKNGIIMTAGLARYDKLGWSEITGGVYIQTEFWSLTKFAPVVSFRTYDSTTIFSSQDVVSFETIVLLNISKKDLVKISFLDFYLQYLIAGLDYGKLKIKYGLVAGIISKIKNTNALNNLLIVGPKISIFWKRNIEDDIVFSPGLYYIAGKKYFLLKIDVNISSTIINKEIF